MSTVEDPARHDDPPGPEHLASTAFIDADHEAVRAFAAEAVGDATGEAERVRRLFAAVRDAIRYDPFVLQRDPAHYAASHVLRSGASYCIPKAVALAAVARAQGIPSRLGFADVKNHLQSEKLGEVMGSDEFVWHGYTELYVDGAWRKASPAFNATLCARFGTEPLDFDGTADALLHGYTGDGARHMEYLRDRGTYADLPLADVLAGIDAAYPGAVELFAATEDPVFQDG